jgi:hypothetical protein
MADEVLLTKGKETRRGSRRDPYPFEDHSDLNRIYAVVALVCWAGGRFALLGILLAGTVAIWVAVISGGQVNLEWLRISLP